MVEAVVAGAAAVFPLWHLPAVGVMAEELPLRHSRVAVMAGAVHLLRRPRTVVVATVLPSMAAASVATVIAAAVVRSMAVMVAVVP
jgi:hypothetical protein